MQPLLFSVLVAACMEQAPAAEQTFFSQALGRVQWSSPTSHIFFTYHWLNSGNTQEWEALKRLPKEMQTRLWLCSDPLIGSEAFSVVMKYRRFSICACDIVNISVTLRHRLVLVTWGSVTAKHFTIMPSEK